MQLRSRAVICLIGCVACAGKPAARAPAAAGGEAAASAADLVAVPLTAATAATAAATSVRQDLLPPWTLTASDGSGLALMRVDAKAALEGPLAFTELHLYFRNDEDRTREGTFQIVLPPRAAISRFAMESAGQWLEAEVVPRLTARRAYDDFLHRRQDPALLEKAAGNQFTAKVFPIAPRSEKHLVLSYSQELPGARYVLPLRGLPRIGRVEIELMAAGSDGARAAQRLAERDWQPDRDFAAASTPIAAAVGAGGLVAAQIELGGRADRDAPRGVTLLVDTSASRALGWSAYLGAVRTLIGELRARWGDALPLEVVAFDQDSERVFEGRAADFGDREAQRLAERGAAGASDLGQALAWIAGHGTPRPRVVVIGDGVITAGIEGPELEARVKQLSGAGVERLDVVLAGGLRDDRIAARLVRAGLPRAGAVLDLEADPVATALGEAVLTDLAIEVPGAAWWYPHAIASARAGTRAMVYARLPRAAGSVEIVAGGQRRTIWVRTGAAPLIERAIAGAELAELEARLPATSGPAAAALREAIAKRSVAARVLSSETSLLVLERDGDYARYGIERQALTDILVIGPGGVERLHRRDLAPIPPRPGPAAPVSNTAPELAVRVRPGDHAPAGRPSAAERPSVEPRPPAEPRSAEPRPGEPRPAESRSIVLSADRPPAASPAGDNDRDGIMDVEDRCPSEAETYNGADDDDGCPDRGRVVVRSMSIEILNSVEFESDRAVIKPASYPILDAILRTLQGNPDIELVEIQGHTDERGDDAHNLELSDRRAAAVKQYLVERGVAASRLSSQGYAGVQPLDRRHTPAAWARNRRVEFVILRRAGSSSSPAPAGAPPPTAPPPPPVTGELAAIQAALAAGSTGGALDQARDWHAREPGNVLALIGLGEALEARRANATAARIYGSIIDLFPGRADLRRFAGERLARLPATRELAIDTFRRAVADRPDHLTGHRLLAYALVRAGRPADAFAAILAGLDQPYRDGSHAGGLRVLGEDAGMIGAAYAAAAPAKRAEITAALARRHLALATRPSTRFVLYWETDANDVDLHIQDARGGHAFFSQPKLASGGELYADVTTGYGPECFAIPGAPQAGLYQLSLDYYSQGPMGYGMGLLQIQTFDPQRGLAFDDRPYVIMTNHAKLDLGTYRP
jgi:outer membrane protein OmpA-like peptidoglycan-associated protein